MQLEELQHEERKLNEALCMTCDMVENRMIQCSNCSILKVEAFTSQKHNMYIVGETERSFEDWTTNLNFC